jgi:signal peptide peptidase SppA
MNPLKRIRRLFRRDPLVPVIRLTGVIGAATPLRQGLSISNLAGTLDRAFSMGGRAVAIQVNSPGGSPVQSRLIYQRIRDLAREKNVRVYMFAEDVAASGGYMIMCAGDEIYADSSSIVGSIGVIYAGFGFVDLIDKLGVERRVHTAGERKMMLDSFQPEKPDDIVRLKALQAEIHRDFADLVRERRGKKIEAAEPQLFTGEFWSGRQALELGLVDGIMDVRTKMRELYGDNVRLKLVSAERGLFRRRSAGIVTAFDAAMVRNAAVSIADDAISAIEARAIWARFGF